MSTYRCRYCRLVHDGSGPSCPLCGAPIDITARVTDSGWIYFSHHVLLWTDAVTTVRTMAADDHPGRQIAGFPVTMLEAHGPGHIGVSDNHAGELIAIPLQHGRRVMAHQSRFLCATGSVAYRWQRSSVYYKKWKGAEAEREYPIGPFCDSFTTRDQPASDR